MYGVWRAGLRLIRRRPRPLPVRKQLPGRQGELQLQRAVEFLQAADQRVRALGPDTGLKITTARYYTPKGRSIQAKGIVPDMLVDETADGNLFAALSTREADLEKHLENGKEASTAEIEKRDAAREAARLKLEEEQRKNPGKRLLPEYGSAQDFRLIQALNHLKGQPVVLSTTLKARDTAAQ